MVVIETLQLRNKCYDGDQSHSDLRLLMYSTDMELQLDLETCGK